VNDPIPRAELLERERNGRTSAGLVALLAALMVAASLILQSAGLDSVDSDSTQERLAQLDENSRVIIGQVLAGVATMFFAYPLLFLFRAARGRSERIRGAFTALILIGPILFGAGQVMTALGLGKAADEYVSQEDVTAQAGQQETTVAPKGEDEQSSGEETTTDADESDSSDEDEESPEEERAEDIVDDQGLLAAGNAVGSAGILAFVFGMVYTGLWAMRTGLLTRFWGSLGMALGASVLLLGPIGYFGIVIWFAALGLQLGGWWPGPRSPAWERGEAVPWPRPGDPPDGPGSQPPGGTVEGEGRELSGDAPELPEPPEGPETPETPSEQGPAPRKRKRRR
jgi:hypothetical protein